MGTVEKKLTQARTHIVLDHPFFGALIMNLKLVESNAVPTMGTDGKRIMFNSDWVKDLTVSEVTGVLAHEVMHVALGHHARQNTRKHDRWNHACDYAINPILVAGGFQFPKGILLDDKYKDMSAEEIYANLPEELEMPQKGQGQSGGGSGSGDDQDGTQGQSGGGSGNDDNGNMPEWGWVEKYSGNDAEAEVQRWKTEVIKASKIARAKGKLPANLERFVNEFVEPVVDWKSMLHDFVDRVARNDYNWSRPNTRYSGTGFVLPSLHNLEMGDITVAIDTSGSIGEHELSIFASELNSIMDTYKVTVNVLYVDAEVNKVETYESGDTLEFKMVGGGGTDFRPAFNYTNENFMPDCACFIYFTDMYGCFPDEEPEYPVMWIDIAGSMDAPWGVHVKYNEVIDAA